MSIDAIVISGIGEGTFSSSNPLRLKIDGKLADIQIVNNFISNNGKLVEPVDGDNMFSWSSAPTLNGLVLYSCLSRENIKVELINDYFGEREYFVELLKKKPKVIVISTSFICRKKELNKLVTDIRSLYPSAYIVAGGPFVYTSYKIFERSGEQHYNADEVKEMYIFHTQNEPSVDLYIVSLRGERLLCKVIKNLIGGYQSSSLNNLVYYNGEKYVFSKIEDDIDKESYFVDWNILPKRVFNSGVIPMQASIGCPYRCAYCNFNKHPKLLFSKDLKALAMEMKVVQSLGVKYVLFVDDNFRLGRNDINETCNLFIKENIRVQWASFFRADALKSVDFKKLKDAGCIEVRLGLESGDEKILENMNKKASPSLYKEVVSNILRAGINCSCYFIFGFPGETKDSVEKTIKFIKSIEYPEFAGNLSWSIYKFNLMPMSHIYSDAMRNKYEMSGYIGKWKHKTMDSNEVEYLIFKAFGEIENSCPIFRGDNMEMLHQVDPDKRKQFYITRHRLSKMTENSCENKTLMLEEFNRILK